MPSRGDILTLIEDWRSLLRTKHQWGESDDGKMLALPSATVETLVALGKKMAGALEEIARR